MLRRGFIKAIIAMTAIPALGPKVIKPYTDKKGWTGKVEITSSMTFGEDNNGNYIVAEGVTMNFVDGVLVDREIRHGDPKVYRAVSRMEGSIKLDAELTEEFKQPTILENFLDSGKRN